MRLGFLVESDKVSSWVGEIISALSNHKEVNFVVTVFCSDHPKQACSFLYSVFKKLDSSIWTSSDNYSEEKTMRFSDNVPDLKTEMVGETFQISFSEDLINKISSYKPDLLIYFGSKTLAGNILDLPRYGIWSLCFGETNKLYDAIPGFWEWYYKRPRSKITLIKFSKQSLKGEIIRDLPIQISHPSYRKNQSSIFSKAIALIVEEVTKLVNTEKLGKESKALERETIFLGHKPIDPNSWHIANAFLKLISRSIKRVIKEIIFVNDWVIFCDLNSPQTPSLDFKKFKVLIPPKNRFWADPFVVSQDDKHYIFFEEFMLKANKGHINCMVLDASGKMIASKIILEKPYHLSYPFIFQHQETFYMVPESSANKTIDLYECVEFPFLWKFKRTLISSINAVDATIHFYENRYWLFCGVQQHVSSPNYEDLNIFYTNDVLEGRWIPHVKNPVVSDIKTARPAGSIYIHNGELCRPSQIGFPYYGYGLALNRITELSEINYKEENYINIKPDWRKEVGGLHTLNFSPKMTVTDGVLKRFRLFK